MQLLCESGDIGFEFGDIGFDGPNRLVVFDRSVKRAFEEYSIVWHLLAPNGGDLCLV